MLTTSDRAEKLDDVRAMAGEDPTEPPHSEPYPYPPVSHEPDMQAIADGIKQLGYYPFQLPMGMKLNEQDMLDSPIGGKLGTAIGLVSGAVAGGVSGDKIAEFAEPTIGVQLADFATLATILIVVKFRRSTTNNN